MVSSCVLVELVTVIGIVLNFVSFLFKDCKKRVNSFQDPWSSLKKVSKIAFHMSTGENSLFLEGGEFSEKGLGEKRDLI